MTQNIFFYFFFFVDPEYTSKVSKQEEELIDKISKSLTPKDIEEIEMKAKELEAHQLKPQDVSCLPTLKIEDISRTTERIKVDKKEIQNIPVTISAQPTNGIVYFRSLVEIPELPEELIPYVPLLANVSSYNFWFLSNFFFFSI